MVPRRMGHCRIFTLLACVLFAAVPDSVSAANLFTAAGGLLQDTIGAVKNPIETGAISVVNPLCPAVKTLLGTSYSQSDEHNEPDTSNLNLVYISDTYNATYNLSTAAQEIPAAPYYDPDQKLCVYLHGFTDDPSKDSFTTMRDALFQSKQCNVLALDASSLIRYLYLHSTTYIVFIGEKLGQVFAAMVDSGLKAEDIHLIGHSLGAHIGGYTGKFFTNLKQQKLGRISGLDPAGPCFGNLDKDYRLNSTDASCVDVIHTDAGVAGIDLPCGHVDYWPEGGTIQPGCFLQTCRHSRAWELYAETVLNPTSMPAVQCDSWADFKKGNCNETYSYMGFASKCNVTGQFYLRTAGKSPYGLGMNGTVYENDEAGPLSGAINSFEDTATGILG